MFNSVAHSFGRSARPSVSVTGTGAYAQNDTIGGVLVLPSPITGLISDMTIALQAAAGVQMDVGFFNTNPGTGFTTDNNPIAGSFRMAGGLLTTPIASSDWITWGGEVVVTKAGLALFVNPLVAIVIIARAAVTLTGADALIIQFGVARDR